MLTNLLINAKICVMDTGLKFDTVVRSGRLNVSTARYVLQSPEFLPGMPGAGSPGRHRRFTIEQAIRLCVCAHLQGAGVPMQQAGAAVVYLAQRLEAGHKLTFGTAPIKKTTDPWMLRLWDSTRIRFDAGNSFSIPSKAAWYRLADGSIERAVPRPVLSCELNISRIRYSLEFTSIEDLPHSDD